MNEMEELEENRKDTNGQDMEDFAREMRNENLLLEEKNAEIEELKCTIKDLEFTNNDFFEWGVKRGKEILKLRILSVFEFILIMIFVAVLI